MMMSRSGGQGERPWPDDLQVALAISPAIYREYLEAVSAADQALREAVNVASRTRDEMIAAARQVRREANTRADNAYGRFYQRMRRSKAKAVAHQAYRAAEEAAIQVYHDASTAANRTWYEARERTLAIIDQLVSQEESRESDNARLRADIAALRQQVADQGCHLAKLTAELDGLRAFKRGVDAALNSGDGSYKP